MVEGKEGYVDIVMDCLYAALDQFYINDAYLVNIGLIVDDEEIYDKNINDQTGEKKKYVGERSAEFRLAYYLQNHICYSGLKQFVVDCEYNRDIYNVKMVNDNAVVPDIIVHMRGTNCVNLLVVELKTHWNKNNSDDINKLKYFTDPNHQYKYCVGVSLVLGRTRKDCKIQVIRNGENCDKM